MCFRIFVVTAFLATVFVLIVPVSGQSLPLDVQLILDHSGSITNDDKQCQKATGVTCWKNIIEWSRQFVSLLKNVTNGFEDYSSGKEGVRVGVIKFSTRAEVEIKLKEGTSSTSINSALDALKKKRPYGRTNLLGALEEVVTQQLDDYDGFSAQERHKVIIVLTDGEFTNSVESTINLALTLRNQGIPIFAIGLGAGYSRAQLFDLTGSEDHIFTVSDANLLEVILKPLLLAASTTFDIHIKNVDDICIGNGQLPRFMLNSNAIQYLGNSTSRLQCRIAVKNAPGFVAIWSSIDIDPSDNQAYCQISGDKLWEQNYRKPISTEANLTLVVEFFYREETRFQSLRMLGEKQFIHLPVKWCLDHIPREPRKLRCPGERLKIGWNGGSTSLFSHSKNTKEYKCIFRSDVTSNTRIEVNAEYLADSSVIQCSLPKFADFILPDMISPSYNDVSLTANGLQTNTIRSFLFSEDIEETCIDVSKDHLPSFCWHETNAQILFHGKTVREWGADVDWLCIFDDTEMGHTSGVFYKGKESMGCRIPETLLKIENDSSTKKDILVSVKAYYNSKEVTVFPRKLVPVIVDPCLKVEIENGATPCLGEPVPLTIHGVKSILRNYEHGVPNEVSCVFLAEHFAVVKSTAIYDEESGCLFCSIPASAGAYLGVRFSTLDIRVKDTTAFSAPIEEIWKEVECFRNEVISKNNNTNLQCWGEVDDMLVFNGRSTEHIVNSISPAGASDSFYCSFHSSDRIFWSPAIPFEGIKMKCLIPEYFNRRSDYNEPFKVDLIRKPGITNINEVEVYSTEINRHIDNSACISISLSSSTNCLGEFSNVAVYGPGLHGIQQAYLFHWERIEFSYFDDEGNLLLAPLNILGGTLAGRISPFTPALMSNVSFLDKEDNVIFQYSNIELKRKDTPINSVEACFEDNGIVSHASCIGDHIAIKFVGGITGSAFSNPDFKSYFGDSLGYQLYCSFTGVHMTERRVIAKFDNENRIICTTPQLGINSYSKVKLFIGHKNHDFESKIHEADIKQTQARLCIEQPEQPSYICPSDESYQLKFRGRTLENMIKEELFISCELELEKSIAATILKNEENQVACDIPLTPANYYGAKRDPLYSFGDLHFAEHFKYSWSIPNSLDSKTWTSCVKSMCDCSKHEMKFYGKEITHLHSTDLVVFCAYAYSNGTETLVEAYRHPSSMVLICPVDSSEVVSLRLRVGAVKPVDIGAIISIPAEKHKCDQLLLQSQGGQNDEEESSESNSSLIIALSVIVVVIVFFIAVLCLARKRRKEKRKQEMSLNSLYGIGKEAVDAHSLSGYRKDSATKVYVDGVYDKQATSNKSSFFKGKSKSNKDINVDTFLQPYEAGEGAMANGKQSSGKKSLDIDVYGQPSKSFEESGITNANSSNIGADMDIDVFDRPRSGSRGMMYASKIFRPFGNNKSPKNSDFDKLYGEQTFGEDSYDANHKLQETVQNKGMLGDSVDNFVSKNKSEDALNPLYSNERIGRKGQQRTARRNIDNVMYQRGSDSATKVEENQIRRAPKSKRSSNETKSREVTKLMYSGKSSEDVNFVTENPLHKSIAKSKKEDLNNT